MFSYKLMNYKSFFFSKKQNGSEREENTGCPVRGGERVWSKIESLGSFLGVIEIT